MKSVSIPLEGLSIDQLLKEAGKSEVVFLTSQGNVRFALVAADEGDEEIMALRKNSAFMNFLSECEQRAATGKRKSLKAIRELYDSGKNSTEEGS